MKVFVVTDMATENVWYICTPTRDRAERIAREAMSIVEMIVSEPSDAANG